MKKISIVLAILAVFLVFSCSNAAGAVDTAGNPVDLAGSWSGSVAYKVDKEAAVSIFTRGVYVDNGKANWGTKDYDYQGTWVKKDTVTKPNADYSTTETSGTLVTTTKHIFDTKTRTVTEKKVVAADGGYVVTIVTKDEWTERAAIGVVADTTTAKTIYVYNGSTYYYNGDANGNGTYDDPVWDNYAGSKLPAIPKIFAGVQTVTETTTVKVTTQADGLFTEETTSVKVTEKTGDRFKDPNTAYGTVTEETANTVVKSNKDKTELGFYGNGLTGNDYKTLDNDSDYEHTVKVAEKKPVKFQNDVSEALTFVVAADGSFTLTSVITETQAAAAAVEATDTHYAAAERKAASKKTTTTTTGSVAAYELLDTEYLRGSTKMVLSSASSKVEVVGTDDWAKTETAELASVSKLEDGEYTIRFINGAGKKEEIKNRLYITSFDAPGDVDNIIILDKAPEAAK